MLLSCQTTENNQTHKASPCPSSRINAALPVCRLEIVLPEKWQLGGHKAREVAHGQAASPAPHSRRAGSLGTQNSLRVLELAETQSPQKPGLCAGWSVAMMAPYLAFREKVPLCGFHCLSN